MKVSFVYPTYESLGIEYLSAVLKKEGHQTELIFDPSLFDDDMHYLPSFKKVFSMKVYIVNKIIKSNADLVAFSVNSDRYLWACDLAREVKRRTKVPIVFGGIHPTSEPEKVISNDFIDYVVVGEGEGAIVDLVERLKNKNDNYDINNVWFKNKGQVIKNEARNLIKNLDSLPFPDKNLYSREYTAFQGQYTIITSRGCPFSCTYCCNNYLRKFYQGKGQYSRYRSIENVIAELKFAKENYRINAVYFFDEELFFQTQRAKELFEAYRKYINLPFWCYVNPRTMDEEKIDILEKSGCCEVEIGVQSLSTTLNTNILKRSMNLKQFKKVINRFQKTKIRVLVDIILGIPTQKEEHLFEMVDFFSKNKIDGPFLFWLRYYPKTDIIDIAVKEGVLLAEECDEINLAQAFYVKGSTYNNIFAKIAILISLSCLLPGYLIRLMARRKVYKYFFPGPFNFLLGSGIRLKQFILIFLGIKRKRIYFSHRFRFYFYYFWKWIYINGYEKYRLIIGKN